jgi:hypothetical protein
MLTSGYRATPLFTPTIDTPTPSTDNRAHSPELHRFYGTSLISRRAARFVDKIRKGTKAGELLAERPMTLDLVINLKTAQTVGLTLPSPLLERRLADDIFQADEVIR